MGSHSFFYFNYIYNADNQCINNKFQKNLQKTLAGNRKKPTFASQFTAEERWVSG